MCQAHNIDRAINKTDKDTCSCGACISYGGHQQIT